MKRFGILLFLLLIIVFPQLSTFAASPNEGDSLLGILKNSPKNDLIYSRLSTLISDELYLHPAKALILAAKVAKIASSSGNPKVHAQAMLDLGIANDISGNYEEALAKYTIALKLADDNNFEELKGDIYNNFSITHAVLGNMSASVSMALKAMAIYEARNDSSRMARIYNNLGSRYAEMDYKKDALRYYQKAADINEKIGDLKKLAFNYGNIGLLYYDQANNDEALEYMTKSMNLQDSVNDGYNFSIALHNMALVYQKLAEYPKALNYENRSYGLAKKNNDGLGQISSLKGMAAIYEDMGMKQKALSYFHQSADLAEKSGARYYLIDIYSSIARLYASLDDYEKAFVFNEKFTALKDSIMTDERDKAMGKVRDFQNEKTQNEIELLTKDSEIQKLTVKRQKIIRNSILSVGILISMLALGLLHRYRYVRRTRNELSAKNVLINQEKDRSDELLLNILPAETAEELKTHGRSDARHFEMVTVMFTDFKGFTQLAEKLTPQQLVDEIDYCFRQFDNIITNHNIEKIKTIGDAYMCAAGLPVTTDSHAVDMVKAALDIQVFMQKLGNERKSEGRPLFEVRIGIHSGPVIAGIVGTKKFQYDIWGDTVNIAARMESSGEAGKINISQCTYDRIKDKFECSHRGKIEAKNKGLVDMYFVENPII